MPVHSAFALEKWYLDSTADDGRTAIAYWTSLQWRGLSIIWQSADLYAPGVRSVHRTSVRRVAAPKRDANRRIRWKSRAIGCLADCEPLQPPFSARFLSEDGGAVDWNCEAAAAHVRIDIAGSAPVDGVGYAERLRLTIPPWRLKIEELRWGRWIAFDGTRSVVWIDWRGPHAMTFVFADGVSQRDPLVSESRVTAGEFSLALEDQQPLVTRALGEMIRPIRSLAALAPRSILRAGETKWRSRGTAAGFDGVARAGWAIHELVRFP